MKRQKAVWTFLDTLYLPGSQHSYTINFPSDLKGQLISGGFPEDQLAPLSSVVFEAA